VATDRLARKINNLTSAVIVLVMLVLGILLLVLAVNLPDSWYATVIEQAGGTLLVAAVLTVAWEAYGRRALAGEVMEVADLSGDVQQAGLTRIGSDHRAAPWSRLLQAEKIDIYLGLGRTFYSTNSSALQASAAKPNTRIRVIIADPTDEAAVECMAERFTRTTAEVRADIRTATDNFLSLGRGAAGTVQVYYRTGEPLTSLYRFDNEALVTLYSHRRAYGDVPFMLCRSGGGLYDFVRAEFDKLIEQGTLQADGKVTPPPESDTAIVPTATQS
jgi:hypothetical protein